MPDGATISFWGFSLYTTFGCDVAQLPGPVLRVPEGAEVTVNLVENSLPVATSIIFPGQLDVTSHGGSGGVFAAEAAPGSGSPSTPLVSYSFTASAAGTYLYESGTTGQPQVPMGLYGALIVDPATPGQAYAGSVSAYEEEAILVLSEIDPALNANPAGFDLLNYNPTYWLINGRAYPDTLDPAAPGTAQPYTAQANTGNRLLVRYVNASGNHHTMMLLDRYQRVIARDANELLGGQMFDAVAETIPSGQTTDVIIDPTGAALNAELPLFNRQLRLTNGDPGPSHFLPGGGMMTFITVTGAGGPTNVPPVAVADGGAAYTLTQGDTLNVAAPGVLGNDNDGGDGPGPLLAVLVSPPANHDIANSGPFTLNADGSFTYVHDGSATTSDSFTYLVNDGVDNSSPATVTITVNPPSMHIGDLDGSAVNSPLLTWTANIIVTVHDGNENPVANAAVAGSWNRGFGGSAGCTTNINGQCTVSRTLSRIFAADVTYTVNNVTAAGYTYQAGANHDPDGSSNGASITVNRP
jgi:FtsP/CotA-like multicopper oxidase with cupredoxin domain